MLCSPLTCSYWLFGSSAKTWSPRKWKEIERKRRARSKRKGRKNSHFSFYLPNKTDNMMEMFMLNSLVSRITIHLLEGQQERPWEGQHWKVYSRVRWMGAWGKRYTSSHSSFQVLKDWTIWCFSYFAFHSISGAGSQSRENKNEEFNEEGKKNDTSCNKGRASP